MHALAATSAALITGNPSMNHDVAYTIRADTNVNQPYALGILAGTTLVSRCRWIFVDRVDACVLRTCSYSLDRNREKCDRAIMWQLFHRHITHFREQTKKFIHFVSSSIRIPIRLHVGDLSRHYKGGYVF